jgi:proteasome lid subunit RPN8/RPN11
MIAETIAQIRAHAERDYPREACGLIAVIDGQERYVPCRNAAAKASDHFMISVEERFAIEDQGEVVAVVHSHPDYSPQPSQADLVSCEESGLTWHIVHVSIPHDGDKPKAGEIVTVNPSGYEAPLVGRQFAHGVLDCYTLIRDFYKRELGVELADHDREDGWWDKGQSLYMDLHEQTGFVEAQGEPKRGDMIVMAIRSKVPNHGAVYLGDGLMLHHLYNRLSSREIYGGYWLEKTCRVFRHKDMM